MTTSSARGNAGYASHDAALGLLSRVYLYMGQDQDVINTVNEMLAGADPASKLDTNFPSYFANALNSRETLFAVAHTALETKGQSSLGSMYINDGMGWGEVYSSDPLNNLYERYPQDIRYQYVLPQYAASGKDVVTFPVETADDDFRSNETRIVTLDGITGKYTFTDEGTKYYVESELVNGEYTEYYVTYKGVKCPARLTKQMVSRNTFPNYYVSKFSYQDGDPMLSSPVMLRWGEVILNRAEAYAKLNQKAEALADVNVLRTRAGLSGNALFTETQMHEYTSVLDVVLDERRLELAFEGHRAFDLYRNKRSMDRRFAGVQPWEVVDYNDNKIQYPIPFDEHSVSGITQNPGY
ncbi:RagB/SusD family nutrient uptake outer membrane protein [Paludibacter sp. 221]|nr:RagB/SusD family nutrient uptake outer membrane protein [Paludibacter sp. 221]